MGSSSSKFKKYLQHGDEFAAMQIYQNSPELRKNVDPNLSYGENHNHNTALHYAAKHGMKHLLRTFLNDLGGNPNKKNGWNETVLHSACQLNQTKSFSAQERRAACVQLLLYWKGVALNDEGGREKINLLAQDKEGNSALHLAAFNGLKKCVELLLAHGAPLFLENNDKMTPCDLAMKGSHHEIARFLESRMVFADNTDVINEDELLTLGQEEVYSGLRSQDLQEAKDQLLVDTSDMLKIPLFTSEALLRNNEWSKEILLEKWMRDPLECCKEAGVQAPSSLLNQGNLWDFSNCTSPTLSEDSNKSDKMCEICLSSIAEKENIIVMSCKHIFCKSCWTNYLTIKIQSGDAHHIMCPAFQCFILVPVEIIEKMVSPEMARRYLQFDIKAFVESSKCIKWCPVAGCGRAVKLPEVEQNRTKTNESITYSHAVDCGNSHFFCWECLGEAHAPCGCNQWKDWHKKISEVGPEEQKKNTNEETEDAANCLWLVSNSKQCPNCKSPIQKNEGCNHMKCSKCKFDFCWVCQEAWKKHSSATGGYFRCNRFEAVSKADEKQVALISEALEKNNQMQEMSRFLHYYTRFRNHENSQKLEEPLLITARQKMEILAHNLDIGEKGMRFFEEGVRELLKARRVLCGSYVYGYYLQDDGCNKTIFEFMQNELEEVTEKLSEMIARPYLRTPKSVIIQTTALARRKRHEFVRAVGQGLVPPETPPSLRKTKKTKYNENIDDATLGDVWKKKKNGSFEIEQQEEQQQQQEQLEELAEKNNGDEEEENHYNCTKIGSDYNVELVIALEMSKLQMIEDRLKQTINTINPVLVAPDPSCSSSSSNENNDDQLKLAIQLSLQETSNNLVSEEETSWSGRQYFSQSNADITVDYFLKTLANHQIDLKSLRVDFNMLRQDAEEMKNDEKELFSSFKPCNGNEDGRFQISDIHENGFGFSTNEDDFDDDVGSMRRCRSTGDLISKRRISDGRKTTRRINVEEETTSFHLDSDHSSQQEEKPEENDRNEQHLLTHREEGQSSIEDATYSDSMNADMEVCEILENVTTDEDLDLDENDRNNKTDDCLKSKLCEAHIPKTYCLTKLAVNKSIGLLQENGLNKNTFKHPQVTISKSSDTNRSNQGLESKNSYGKIFSKSTSFLNDNKREEEEEGNTKLKMGKSEKRCLETDSSNEYESETGIPRSPTLFISGVSISRTPEPKSPKLLNNNNLAPNQTKSRSCSISVVPLSTTTTNSDDKNERKKENESPKNKMTSSSTSSLSPKSIRCSPKKNISKTNNNNNKENSKSKSANEPEREREVFKFPKSSTDGALSSVLHVQESNLSSDDFHEVLFLFERSPKSRDSRRKKRSKKKDKDDINRREESSSAL